VNSFKKGAKLWYLGQILKNEFNPGIHRQLPFPALKTGDEIIVERTSTFAL
jgi:hypothetical protein